MCYNIFQGDIMKICVFSDIHGNYDALSLLMKSDDFLCSDLRICLGDVVIMGPNPNECIKSILDNNCIWLLGNHDSYIANGLPKEELENFNEDKLEHQKYMDILVKEEYKKVMRNLPKSYVLEVNNKKLYFTHYIWETNDNVVDCPSVVSLATVSDIFNEINADYIFYGHEHDFSCFKDLKKEYICVGSLGLKHPGHYSVIDINELGDISVNHKIIDFDIDKFISYVSKKGYPRCDKCIDNFK